MKPFSGGVIEDAGLALRFVLSTPDIVPIPGIGNPGKGAGKLEDFFGRSPDLLTEEDQARIQTVRQQFDRQFCRRCDYCQPCSQNINIQMAMGMRAVIKRFPPPRKSAG